MLLGGMLMVKTGVSDHQQVGYTSRRGAWCCYHLGGGVGSSPANSPPPEEVASDGLDMAALIHHEEELELGEDFFMWPRPTNPHEALFVVDNTTE